jgi:hypothetical protein
MLQPKRKAVVRNGVVENIILAADDFPPPAGCTLVDDDGTARINGTYDGAFHPPVVIVDRAALIARVDQAYRDAIAPKLPFLEEYKQREAQAQAFKDGGYAGAVPARVAEFATPAGLTAQQATDLILQQASAMRDAMGTLAAQRMRKYEVQRAATDAAALNAFNDIVARIGAAAVVLA